VFGRQRRTSWQPPCRTTSSTPTSTKHAGGPWSRGSLTSYGSGAVLKFQTQGGFKTRCQFDQYPTTVHPGDTISVVAEGATAERLTSAVLPRGCSLLSG
jgi:hypothetical protein